MTERRSPLEAALDLVLYAPVGLALTLGEEIPKLAAKGRGTVSTRVTTARLVGQFAVTQGRRELDRRLGASLGSAVGSSAPAARPPATTLNTPPAGNSPTPSGATAATDAGPTSPSVNGAGARSTRPTPARSAPAKTDTTATSQSEPGIPADTLAIPGYDSLSASQVVQRLAGLSAAELEAVKAYETANRGRRTILTRAGQLQGS